ncbi:hypothetical protein LA76x_2838 [Lysobacter antibioticus]|uniref:Uncharacterized protein n=1 Tax=Lysobacter antibioticus TaxID=84531 RepID=A0A0S2FBQ3_LYSAN|nr:hypothetical protein LA76x_2838 [Lysobacter antibioticus]
MHGRDACDVELGHKEVCQPLEVSLAQASAYRRHGFFQGLRTESRPVNRATDDPSAEGSHEYPNRRS